MKYRRWEKRFALLELILSAGILMMSVLLIVDMDRFGWAFIPVFSAAAVLFFVKALYIYQGKSRRRIGKCIFLLCGAAAMIALLCASVVISLNAR